MLPFVRKNQVVLSSCFCLLVSLYIVTAAARGQLHHDPLGPALLWLLRPLHLGAQTITGWGAEIQRGFATATSLRSENERLRSRVQELEAERNRLLEAEATNQRLQELLEFRARLPVGSVTASIIANSASSWFQSSLLDRGSVNGVRKGMAVVTPLGVLGQVVSVTKHNAKVLLLTDPNSGVDVLVQRTRTRGIVSGSLDNGTIMKYVKRTEDVREGDRLLTSGVDGVFPKGLLVGTVTRVEKQQLGLFQLIEVAPAVVPSRVEEVLVVAADEHQHNP